jgi:hypothetical protein
MEKHFYRDIKQKPDIGDRSRKIMRSITPESVQRYNVRPWKQTHQSNKEWQNAAEQLARLSMPMPVSARIPHSYVDSLG